MSKNKIIKLLMSISILLSWGTTYSSTKTCTKVDDLAKVGYRKATASMSCTGGWSPEARISINGASAGSPPQEQVQAGLLLIKEQKIFDKIQSSDVKELAAAILAASRVKEVPDIVMEKLLENKDGLLECFDDFYTAVKEDRKMYYKTFVNNKVNCTVTGTATVELAVDDSNSTVLLKSDEPSISISVSDEEKTINSLTVTAGYIKQQCQ